MLRALRTRGYREVVTQALQAPPPGASFASLEYYVDAAAAQTLQFAALAALSTHLQSEEVLAPAQLLPQVSRVLLQTEEPQAGRFLEAVAAALASQMSAGAGPRGAEQGRPGSAAAAEGSATAACRARGGRVPHMRSPRLPWCMHRGHACIPAAPEHALRRPAAGLLLVDGMLLATLAGTTFGRPPEAYLAAFSGAGAAASSPLTARDAARLRLAWRALREVLYDLERPTGERLRGAGGGREGVVLISLGGALRSCLAPPSRPPDHHLYVFVQWCMCGTWRRCCAPPTRPTKRSWAHLPARRWRWKALPAARRWCWWQA